MVRLLVLLILCLSGASSFAQIPELEILFPDSAEFSILPLGEQAAYYADHGQTQKAESMLITALDNHALLSHEFLLLANCELSLGNTALAQEFYKEYLKSIDQEYGIKADIINSLFTEDNTITNKRKIMANSFGLYGTCLYNSKLYSPKNDDIIAMELNCSGDLNQERPIVPGDEWMRNGSITFYDDGYKAILTIINSESQKAALYRIVREANGWSKPKQLKFVDDHYNYAFPYFDEKSNILYFSSDKPGGAGGYDIHLSYYTQGKFQEPTNLGTLVNTRQNEIFPKAQGGWLYFSSNGLPSKGGYDIYAYRALDDFNSVVKNLKNYNTSNNEFSFFIRSKDQYLISSGDKSKNYLVQYETKIGLNQIFGIVRNDKGERVQNALVALANASAEGHYVKTNENGEFKFLLEPQDSQARILIYMDDYLSTSTIVKTGVDNNIILRAYKPVEIVKVIEKQTEGNSGSVTYKSQDSGVAHEDKPIDEEFINGVISPEKEVFYVILGSAKDYTFAYRIWNKWIEQYPTLKIIKFGPHLYRVGYSAGKNELNAISALQETISKKSDAWIIRPSGN